ncbi:MAG: S1C family serine protease [Clostridium perfringens]|nr:S1C family serine protease [Clostridium perfringens]
MENKVSKRANLTILLLGLFLLLASSYCAIAIKEENIIILLSLICVATWICMAINFRRNKTIKGSLKSLEDKNLIFKSDVLEEDDDNVLKSIFEEDTYRVDMLKKSMEATVMLVDKDRGILGTAVFINNEGNLLASGYKLDNNGKLKALECGERLFCRFYDSDKLIEGIVEKIIKDKDGNLFSIISISLNDYTKYLSLGDSNDLGIGNKVYGICPFEENKNINVVEGIVAQINQEYKLKSDNINVFKSSNCILYNGISTKASIGGPLLNIHGEIVGILLGKCSEYDRLSFAVSINNLKDIIESDSSNDVLNEVATEIYKL